MATVASSPNPDATRRYTTVSARSLGPNMRSAAVAWLSLSALSPSVAHAGDWLIQPRFQLGETWTDNPRLESAAQNPESDWITTLSPGISLLGTGRRLKFDTDYSAQKQIFANNSDLSQLTHLLQSNVRTEVVRDSVFVNAFASMFPTIQNNLGQISNRNRNSRLDANRAEVVTYGFAPEVRHRLGNWAQITARTEWSDVSTGDDATGVGAIGGGQNMIWRTGIQSGSRFQRFGWGSDFSRRENDGGDTGQRAVFQVWTNTLNYRLNRLVRLNSSFGYESNDFQGATGIPQSGVTWLLGATLSPSPRTTLTGAFGERVFGSTKQFSFTHRWRRFIINGNYNEELRTTAELLREQQVFQRLDPFGNPIIDPVTNADPTIPINQLGLTNDTFIARNFGSTIGYSRRRDSFSMRVNRSEQESAQRAETNTLFDVGGSWVRTLSRRWSAGIIADYQQREASNFFGESDFLSLSPFFTYVVGPQVRSRVSYQYTDSVSADQSQDFTENALTGSLTVAF